MVKRLLVFRPTLGDGGADRVTITLLQHLDRARFAPVLVLLRRTGKLVDEVPADVPVIELGSRRLALSAGALARTIRAERPDVIFSTSSGCNPVAVVARALAGSRARLVLSERNALVRDTFTRARSMIEIPLKRLAYHRADVVTAVSDGVAADLRQRLGLPAAKVVTVWNPVVMDDVDGRAAEPVDDPWFDGTRRVLLACGRLVDQKDYPTLLAAFERIHEREPDVVLAILGEGALRDDLVGRIDRLGLGPFVRLLGFDSRPLRYMSRATLLVQSSRAEGLPGTLIQSMAVGTPVVATDCDFGPREVIEDGVDGYLVPVGDAATLAERVVAVLRDPALRTRLSARARVSARRFTIATSMGAYERALLGESGASA